MGGGMASGRNTSRSRRSQYSARSAYSYGSEPRPQNDVQLDLSIGAPPTNYNNNMAPNSEYGAAMKTKDAGNRSIYDAGGYSQRSSRAPSRTARSVYSQSQYSEGGEYEDDEEAGGYTNSVGLIGAKAKPDPGQPYLLASGSPTKAHVISNAYNRYEDDIKRRQGAADKLDKEAQDRQRLQQQVEILKSEQKRREQQEMKRMLAKQVVERQKKREEERREKLVPYDLTHVLPLERERDFFQEYAEKQGMKRALFKQMEEKKNIKQRELDRERAMDLESKEALASSLAKEHALNTYTRMNAGNMLRDNWAKQIRLHNVERRIDGDH